MASAELLQLIDADIPEGRQHLQESHTNLERVAQYCEEHYVQNTDKRRALEETQNYTTHSLASVAYQINSLASNFIKLLDLQQNQMAEMESSVNHLAQTVMIHKEKVARREIGVLTTNKNIIRPSSAKNGILIPQQREAPIKYNRKPIDYTDLDEIGHGVKVHRASGPSSTRPTNTSRSNSIGSGSSNSNTQAPTSRPPTPPSMRGGTIGRSASKNNSNYSRTPAPPVAPPSVPNPYAPGNYMAQMTPAQQKHAYGDYAGMMGQMHMPPPVGVSRPMSHAQNQGQAPPSPGAMFQDHHGRHLPSHMNYPGSADSASSEPETVSIADSFDDSDSPASPPLPPPPEQTPPTDYDHKHMNQGSPPPPPPAFGDVGHRDKQQAEEPYRDQQQAEDPYATTGPDLMEPRWAPKTYMEKVVAIYDYEALKEDELNFHENCVLYVIKKNDDGWWEGVLDGVTGLFPHNYVEPCI